MKLSLWSQFSSNHSANFTVVGHFESASKAQFAAERLEVILTKLALWWDQLSRDEMMFWGERAETSRLTPPELELSHLYDVEWPFSLDWYRWTWDREISPVSVLGPLVFIRNPHDDIYKGPQPFNDLMTLFGGIVSVEADESGTYPNTILLVHIICKAPDETAAESLVGKTRDYTQHLTADFKHALTTGALRSHIPIPWLAYHSGMLDERADKMKRVEELVAEGLEPMDWKENQWIGDAMLNTDLGINFLRYHPELEPSAQREGVSLSFSNLCFLDWVVGLRAFLAWLKDANCTEIHYQFSQVTENRTKGSAS
jgi:hypothetical protein